MAKPDYESLYRASVADLAKLKDQADNAGNDANAIGALADRIAELAVKGAKALEPTVTENAAPSKA